MRGPVGIIVTK